MSDIVSDLRRRLARIARPKAPAQDPRADLFSTGSPALDAVLEGGLKRGGLHEIFARAQADTGSACGFGLALAHKAAGKDRDILWVRQDFCGREAGEIYAPGLAEIGIAPHRIVLLRARDALSVLRGGVEAARCSALGAVILEPWGMPKPLDFTASRRLALAAEGSGVPVLLIRTAAQSTASAAATRWQVAAHPSLALAANAPGLPAFRIDLMRHRAGGADLSWSLEWNRDEQNFREIEALSGAVVSAPAGRQASQVLPLRNVGGPGRLHREDQGRRTSRRA